MIDEILKDGAKSKSDADWDKLYKRLNRDGGVDFEIDTHDGKFEISMIRVA